MMFQGEDGTSDGRGVYKQNAGCARRRMIMHESAYRSPAAFITFPLYPMILYRVFVVESRRILRRPVALTDAPVSARSLCWTAETDTVTLGVLLYVCRHRRCQRRWPRNYCPVRRVMAFVQYLSKEREFHWLDRICRDQDIVCVPVVLLGHCTKLALSLLKHRKHL